MASRWRGARRASRCFASSRRARSRRKLPDAAPTLELAWEACDAWLSFLPDVAQQGFSNDYGDDGVLTDDDGPAVAMRAVDAVAALATLRFQQRAARGRGGRLSAVRARARVPSARRRLERAGAGSPTPSSRRSASSSG